MTKVFKIISVTLLLLAGSGSVFAGPEQHQEWRDTLRIDRQQRVEQQGATRGDQFQYQTERRRSVPEANFPPGGNNGQGAGTYGSPDGARRSGRMTPEERRALRRQINEAGRDIYAPTR